MLKVKLLHKKYSFTVTNMSHNSRIPSTSGAYSNKFQLSILRQQNNRSIKDIKRKDDHNFSTV